MAGSGAAAADLIAARVSPEFGQEVTAANVRFLVATKLAPLGVVIAEAPGPDRARLAQPGPPSPGRTAVPSRAAVPGRAAGPPSRRPQPTR